MTLEVVRPPTAQPVGKHLIVVVDRSGSLDDHAPEVLACAMQLASPGSDDMRLRVVAFGTRVSAYPGKGAWMKLPTLITPAENWLRVVPVGSDHTHGPSALAFALTHKRSGLCVVMVTDGQFCGPETEYGCGPVPPDKVVGVVRAQQAWRKKAGIGKALICVVGVGCERLGVLEALAKEGQGGFYRWKPS